MIPVEVPHLDVATLSHPGEKRTINEDRFSVTAYQLEDGGTPSLLAVVADGIGGHQAGEVAAELTVDVLVERLAASTGKRPLAALKAAISEAGQTVHEAAKQDPSREGMGSTVAVAWILGERLYVAYVGDSRIYLLRKGGLRQISIDHTWVQEAIDHEVIRPDEAVDHPHAHVLRRHIGGAEPPEPDLRLRLEAGESEPRSLDNQGLKLVPGDQLLLCSDGLTDLVTDVEIEASLRDHSPKAGAEHLVDLARRRGGHDNITVVILRRPERRRLPRSSGCGRLTVIGALAASLLVAVAVAAAGWYYGWWPTGLIRTTQVPGQSPAPTLVLVPPTGTLEPANQPTAIPPSATSTSGPTSTPIPLPTVPTQADEG